MRVFIENEAGSHTKHLHDEKTLELRGSRRVARPYPFPYGFVLNTQAEDGDNVDCFVLTLRPLKRGQLVECEPVALMEQMEDNQQDHNVLAVMPGEHAGVTPEVQQRLREFVSHVFEDIPGKKISVGRFLGRKAAEEYVRTHSPSDAAPAPASAVEPRNRDRH